jgi:SAM-dependent methyltransferase/uncharacterized protein YbaR (Trm112 family)
MIDAEKWLAILCCPSCRGDLAMGDITQRDTDQHIMSGTLRCTQCQAIYPIQGGVPRFANLPQSDSVVKTVGSFGYQWNDANELVVSTQLSQPELFLDFIAPIQPNFFAGKTVLDGGCGQARFTHLAQQFGASAVVGVDLSDAVNVAFANMRPYPNVLIIQADLLKLPLKQAFDYIFSVGVLHHTRDPKGSFTSLSSVLKPSGGISAWVYGREGNGWIVYGLNPIRKWITSRMPYRLLQGISFVLAIILYAVIKGIYLPVNQRPFLRFLKPILFYNDYLVWLGKYCGLKEIQLVIFDHLSPNIAEYIPRDDFEKWFTDIPLHNLKISSKASNSWRGFGEK